MIDARKLGGDVRYGFWVKRDAVFGWIGGQFVPDFGESLAELVELCVCIDRVFALTNEAGDQLLLLLETLIETCFV